VVMKLVVEENGATYVYHTKEVMYTSVQIFERLVDTAPECIS
jgi:hypothetical protein